MAYTKFKATVWSAAFEKELIGSLQSKAFVNTKFKGKVGRGKKVMIQSYTNPAVTTFTGANTNFTLPAATPLSDAALALDTDIYDVINLEIGDIDQAQASGDLGTAAKQAIVNSLSVSQDKYVFSQFQYAPNIPAVVQVTTSAQMKEIVDGMFVKLWENNVKIDDRTFVVLSPFAYNLFKDNILNIATDNKQILSSGYVGKYNNASVLMSNYIFKNGTGNADEHIGVLTDNAIALASGFESIEPYRIQEKFSDGLKALSTYGSKIYNPKEIVVAKITKEIVVEED